MACEAPWLTFQNTPSLNWEEVYMPVCSIHELVKKRLWSVYNTAPVQFIHELVKNTSRSVEVKMPVGFIRMLVKNSFSALEIYIPVTRIYHFPVLGNLIRGIELWTTQKF